MILPKARPWAKYFFITWPQSQINVKPHYTTGHTVVNEGLDLLEIDVHRKVFSGDDTLDGDAPPIYVGGEIPPLYMPSGWRPNRSDIPQWV